MIKGTFDIDIDHIPIAAECGFDVVQTYSLTYDHFYRWEEEEAKEYTSRYLDEAEKHNVKVLLYIPRFFFGPDQINKPKAEPNLRKYIQEFSTHPAVHAWYLADEPEYQSKYNYASPLYYDTLATCRFYKKDTPVYVATADWVKHWGQYKFSTRWNDIRYMCSNYMIRRYYNTFGIGNDIVHWMWRHLIKKYGLRNVVPIIQTHDHNLWTGKGYRDPTQKEIISQLDRAIELDVPEIWSFGIHAYEGGRFPYNIETVERTNLARVMNNYIASNTNEQSKMEGTEY
jgi:hypothetical protein